MALDISKFARMNEFSMELDSLVCVDCLSLTAGHLSQAIKKLESPSIRSQDLVRWLFGETARHTDESRATKDEPIAGESLSPEELSSVEDGKLEEFAEKLIQKNRYLLKTHKGEEIERSSDESSCDFLVRVFRHYAAEQKEQWKRLTEPLSQSLFADSTVEAMQRNLGLSNQFQDTIDKYARGYSGVERILAEEREKWDRMNNQSLSASAAMQRNYGIQDQFLDMTRNLSDIAPSEAESRFYVQPPHIPELHIPKNPIHDTNEMLESVVRQIEDLRPMAAQAAEIIRSMNDTALRMQTDYIQNAKTAGRQTKFAIWIAAVSLAVSSFFSYQTYVDAKYSSARNDTQVKVFQSEIRDLVAAQREDRAAIVKAIMEHPSEHAKISKPKPSSSVPH
jgi:hypothetical protein